MPTDGKTSTRVTTIPQTGGRLLVLGLALILAMILTLISVPGAHAQGPACLVTADDGASVYGSVQDALDAALSGATVKIAGTCSGVVTRAGTDQTAYVDKPLTLRGGYDGADWATSDPAAYPTTLDALGLGRVVRIDGAVPVTIQDLTVTGGVITGLGLCPDECGAGILATGPIALDNVTVAGNSAERIGGGLAAMDTANVTASRFEGNSATSGHGQGAGMVVYGPLRRQPGPG